MKTFIKDPDATLDYLIDWSDWLETDTISSSSWTADSGITVSQSTNTTTTATVILSGGTVKNVYKVVNSITTAAGLTDNRTLLIKIEEK